MKWEGSGWLGEMQKVAAGSRAESILGSDAEPLAEACLVERTPGDFGTSILVVGFDEPALEETRDLESVCEAMAESASRWFWPGIANGEIDVLVEGWENDERRFERHAQESSPETRPFVEAMQTVPETDETLDAPGEVIERDIEVTVPAQRHLPGRIDSPGMKQPPTCG